MPTIPVFVFGSDFFSAKTTQVIKMMIGMYREILDSTRPGFQDHLLANLLTVQESGTASGDLSQAEACHHDNPIHGVTDGGWEVVSRAWRQNEEKTFGTWFQNGVYVSVGASGILVIPINQEKDSVLSCTLKDGFNVNDFRFYDVTQLPLHPSDIFRYPSAFQMCNCLMSSPTVTPEGDAKTAMSSHTLKTWIKYNIFCENCVWEGKGTIF